MMQVLVAQDPAKRNGFALIRITGAGAAAGDPRFAIQRPDERAGFLGNEGWQPAETLLGPEKFWVDGADLVLEIGPSVVDLVEHGTVGFSLPSARLSRTVIWPVLQPSRGAGGEVFQAISKAATAPVIGQTTMTPARSGSDGPTVRQAPPAPVEPIGAMPAPPFIPAAVASVRDGPVMVAAEPPVVPARRKSSGWLPVLLALLVLALLGGGAWYDVTKPGLTAAPGSQIAGQPTTPAVLPAAANDCDAAPLPALFQCEKNPAKLYAIGAQRMQAGNMRDAVQIFETAAQDGNGAAALALASLYDPATFQASEAVTHADVAEAARYYRMAVNDGAPAAGQPRDQLYQLLQQRAAQGDIQAPLILNDFWR